MADVRLRRDEGHLDPIPDAPFAKLRIQDIGELVSRPETGGALHRANHNRSGITAECLERLMRLYRMIDMTDRLCVRVRSQAFDFIERKVRPGRDH